MLNSSSCQKSSSFVIIRKRRDTHLAAKIHWKYDSVPEGDVSVTSPSDWVTSPATNERIKRRISFGILSIWHIGADSMKRGGRSGAWSIRRKKGKNTFLAALTKLQNLSVWAGNLAISARRRSDEEYNH